MHYKDHTRKIMGSIGSWLRPVATALVLVGILRVTGLMSYVSYAGQWALITSGFKNAETESDSDPKDFDFAFTIKDLNGKKYSFDQFKGKVIFLNLWATWCGPCRAEMPGIHQLYEKMDKEKYAFIMLSLDRDGDESKVVKYLQKNQYTFDAYLPSGYLPEQLQVPSIPTTFIISKDGKLIKKHVGSQQYDTPKFKDFLEELSQQ